MSNFCPSCNATLKNNNALFCVNCGAVIGGQNFQNQELLQQHSNSLVNFINFNLNPKTFEPLESWRGFGRFYYT